MQWAPTLEQVRVTLSHIPAIDGLRVIGVMWIVAANSLYGMGTSIGPVSLESTPPCQSVGVCLRSEAHTATPTSTPDHCGAASRQLLAPT